MSRVDMKLHLKLLKEAKVYLKDVVKVDETVLPKSKDKVVLTQEHIMEWLEVFHEDRIMLDGCNFATVKR